MSKIRIFIIIEIIVGVLIVVGGVFVLTTNTKAPAPTSSPAPQFSTYISSILQISLQYPYGWQIDPNFNGIPGIERYQGSDGYFQVDATNDPASIKGKIIKKYPKPIKIGDTTYKYFVLSADAAHLKEIGDSVVFTIQ